MANYPATPRGFSIYGEITDTYGSRVRVQESSSAEGHRCWIFAENDEIPNGSPHLDRDQAIAIREALDAFIRETTPPGDIQNYCACGYPIALWATVCGECAGD